MRPIRFTLACAQALGLLVVALPLLVVGETQWHYRAWRRRRQEAADGLS